MRYAIYEDPATHRFALLPVPSQFVDGDKPPILDVDRWFSSREEAIAALPDLLNREEPNSAVDSSTKRENPHDARTGRRSLV